MLSVFAALGMCWLYVCITLLGAHLVLLVLSCMLVSSGVLGTQLVQERSGPCKIPNFSHLL